MISEDDAQRFRMICPPSAQIEVTGDTRFDRVYQRAVAINGETEFFPGQSTLQRPILIAGSTYLEEEQVVLEAYHRLRENASHNSNCNDLPHLILVPHEPTAERIDEIQTQLNHLGLSRVRFSELQEDVNLGQIDVIVIDTVGLLAQLYQLGDVAFVGGSFHGSVHNVMEPAAMAKPILFGPTIHNAYEAGILKERGAAQLINNAEEMVEVLTSLLSDEAKRIRMGQIGKQIIEENLGASERTLAQIKSYLTI